MDDGFTSKATFVEIFNTYDQTPPDNKGFICIFHCNDASKLIQKFSTKEAKFIDNPIVFDELEKTNSLDKVAEFDLTSTLGKYIYKKYIQEPQYRQIPKSVNDIIEYITFHQLPVVLGPNRLKLVSSKGCYDASKVRKHLVNAQEFMPIYDELKSILFIIGRHEKQYYVATHCRGNRVIDEKKLSLFLKEKFHLSNNRAKYISMVKEADLNNQFSLKKGRVTPFFKNSMVNNKPVLHIFDSDCLKSYGMPMMTNANHDGWATEFVCSDLIDRFIKINPKKYFVHHITKGQPSSVLASLSRYHEKVLGVIEYGLPAATMFRSSLNKFSKKHMLNLAEPTGKDDEHIKLVHAGTFSEFSQHSISSPEFEKVMEPDLYGNSIRLKISETIKKLENSGCNIIAIPCNILPHYTNSNKKVLSITKAVEKAILKKSGYGLILGGRSVNDNTRSIYKNKFESDINNRIIYLSIEEAQSIDEAMMAVNIGDNKRANEIMYKVLSPYANKIHFIVIASTSLSVFFKDKGSLIGSEFNDNPPEPGILKHINNLSILDTLSIYAEYCAIKLFE